jgi:thioredoxin-dependent peroxiredoxin
VFTPGSLAPSFAAVTVTGESIRLEQWRGKRVFLNLFRFSHCSFCSLQVWYLAQRYRHWVEQGGVVIVVMESNAQDTQALVDQVSLPFPVIADPQGTLYRLYQAKRSLFGSLASLTDLPAVIQEWKQVSSLPRRPMNGPRTRMPAQFLINEQGIIVQAWYAKRLGSFLPLEEVDRFLAKLPQIAETSVQEKGKTNTLGE